MPETTPLIKAALNLRVGAGFDVYIKAGVLFSNVKTSFGLYAILGTIWVQQLCNYINKTQNRIKMMRF